MPSTMKVMCLWNILCKSGYASLVLITYDCHNQKIDGWMDGWVSTVNFQNIFQCLDVSPPNKIANEIGAMFALAVDVYAEKREYFPNWICAASAWITCG
jgi:hypothetical protein